MLFRSANLEMPQGRTRTAEGHAGFSDEDGAAAVSRAPTPAHSQIRATSGMPVTGERALKSCSEEGELIFEKRWV